MNCSWVAEQLSAYVDQELDLEARRHIDKHVEQCDPCRAMVIECCAMGTLMRRSEQIVDTDAVWDRLASDLNAPTLMSASNKTRRDQWTIQWGLSILAAAASIILLFFVVRNSGTQEHDANALSHNHASLAVDFAEVLRSAKSEPKQAIVTLVSKYAGLELSNEDTNKYLGYEPAVFKSVPAGFTRVSTHVLNMPCCKCSATICERSDGTSLIVFEHKDEQPVWFGDSPAIETQCAGMSCKIIESAGHLAVSWKNQDRQLTMIGANDIAEVNQWVASLRL